MIRVAVCQWFPPTLWCQGGGEIHSEQYINFLNKQAGVKAFRFCPLTNQEFDILHILGTNYHLNEIGKYARLADKKVVLTPIVYNPRHPYQYRLYIQLFNAIGVRTLISTRKEILENTDIILANTSVEKEFIEKAYGIKPSRIGTVGIGVAVDEYKDISGALFKEKYGLDQYVLSVGRVTPLKRQLDVLEAARAVGVPLVLVGPPDKNSLGYVKKVEDQIKMSNGLWIKGIPYNSPDLLSAYSGSICHVLFSTSETAGLVNIEALCAGTIAVTCPHETVKEILGTHGVYASSLADLKGALKAVIDLPKKERNRRVENSKEYIRQNHSWYKVAKDTAAIYEQVLSGE